jgi:hypothetical protein
MLYLALFRTTNLDFRMTKRNATLGAEKAPQGFIPVPEGTFQLEAGISNPQALASKTPWPARDTPSGMGSRPPATASPCPGP